MKAAAIITTLLLSSCAGEITPDQARAGAEAARAWLEVAREAKVIITEDK